MRRTQVARAMGPASHPCIKCKGTGRMAFSFSEAGKPAVTSTMECIYCNATGRSARSEAEQWEAERLAAAMWCTCRDSSGSSYHPDQPGMKHHWTCDDCGKITQVG